MLAMAGQDAPRSLSTTVLCRRPFMAHRMFSSQSFRRILEIIAVLLLVQPLVEGSPSLHSHSSVPPTFSIPRLRIYVYRELDALWQRILKMPSVKEIMTDASHMAQYRQVRISVIGRY